LRQRVGFLLYIGNIWTEKDNYRLSNLMYLLLHFTCRLQQDSKMGELFFDIERKQKPDLFEKVSQKGGWLNLILET